MPCYWINFAGTRCDKLARPQFKQLKRNSPFLKFLGSMIDVSNAVHSLQRTHLPDAISIEECTRRSLEFSSRVPSVCSNPL